MHDYVEEVKRKVKRKLLKWTAIIVLSSFLFIVLLFLMFEIAFAVADFLEQAQKYFTGKSGLTVEELLQATEDGGVPDTYFANMGLTKGVMAEMLRKDDRYKNEDVLTLQRVHEDTYPNGTDYTVPDNAWVVQHDGYTGVAFFENYEYGWNKATQFRNYCFPWQACYALYIAGPMAGEINVPDYWFSKVSVIGTVKETWDENKAIEFVDTLYSNFRLKLPNKKFVPLYSNVSLEGFDDDKITYSHLSSDKTAYNWSEIEQYLCYVETETKDNVDYSTQQGTIITERTPIAVSDVSWYMGTTQFVYNDNQTKVISLKTTVDVAGFEEKVRDVMEANGGDRSFSIDDFEEYMFAMDDCDEFVDTFEYYYTKWKREVADTGVYQSIITEETQVDYNVSLKLDNTNAASGDVYIAKGDFVWPIPGYTYISCPFGDTVYHNPAHKGVDIVGAYGGQIYGANVYATASGTVIAARYNSSMGNYVKIDHGNGIVSIYMHNSQIYVSEGQQVSQGQLISAAGNTGNSTGAHLHFQINVNNTAVDPMNFFDGDFKYR